MRFSKGQETLLVVLFIVAVFMSCGDDAINPTGGTIAGVLGLLLLANFNSKDEEAETTANDKRQEDARHD